MFELTPRVVGGREYLLTMALRNASQSKSVWLALNSRDGAITLTDPQGIEFVTYADRASGFRKAEYYDGSRTFTELKPMSTIDTTLKFFSVNTKSATSGRCLLQLELLLVEKYNASGSQEFTPQNIIVNLDAK